MSSWYTELKYFRTRMLLEDSFFIFYTFRYFFVVYICFTFFSCCSSTDTDTRWIDDLSCRSRDDSSGGHTHSHSTTHSVYFFL